MEQVTQELIDKAIQIIVDHRKISPTMLQRNLLLSYNLSAQIMWKLENMGIVWPQDWAKPRVIYFDKIKNGN